MSTPHKHAEYIKAMAEGVSVDMRAVGDDTRSWTTLFYFYPFDNEGIEFRLTPHKWQTEIDAQKAGKAVQGRLNGEAWMEGVWNFNDKNSLAEFRIKPEMLRFRMHKYKSPFTGKVSVQATDEDVEGFPYFLGWLGDWQEVEA